MSLIMNNSKNLVLTMGIFDGVHLGHRELLKNVLREAKKKGGEGILMTFDPHPARVLSSEVKLLFELQDRLRVISELGLSNIQVIHFDKELSQLSAEEFFDKFILKKWAVKTFIVGYDFSFGKNRRGTGELLENLCKQNSISLCVVPPFKIDGKIVSSSAIRGLIESGDVSGAGKLLSRPYYFSGKVIKGAGRGKKMGVPTVNILTQAEVIPRRGVYVTHVEVNEKKYKGVTNIGRNPTFENSGLHIESHILDFKEDIYGEEIKIHFYTRLRDEMKFNTVEELVTQMNLDISKAREGAWPRS